MIKSKYLHDNTGVSLEFFLKHQKIIIRSLGAIMLLVGFVIHFWLTPKQGLSKSELAAANVARMEASVAGTGSSSVKEPKSSSTHIMKAFEEQQRKQMQYFTIIVMALGIGALGYSFIKKEDSQA